MEWIDPVYCGGHWLPEMVELAGGVDAFGRKESDSVRIAWADVLEWAPEILIISPCGFHLDRAVQLSQQLATMPEWLQLPAAQSERVFAVDADSYFARPGPRIADGVELLAHLIHPTAFSWSGPTLAYSQLKTKICEACHQPFLCGGQRCWCAEIPVSSGALRCLDDNYRDCLCPNCLKSIAEPESIGTK
jgi:hypothetical protein